MANGVRANRRCFEARTSRKKERIEVTATTKGHPWPDGRLDGCNTTPDAAVDEQVIVALPVVCAPLNVIVFGAVKFESGTPKLQVGG